MGNSNIGRSKAALWIGAGALLAILAVLTLPSRDDDAGTAPDSLARAPTTERVSGAESAPEPSPGTRPNEVRDVAAVGVVEESAAVQGQTLATAPPPTSAFASNPIVANAPPSNSPATPTGLPNRRADEASAAMPAADILDSLRISCDFAAGNNTGLRFGELLTVGGGAQWRGGLIVYDNIDLLAGTARMIGSVGATGSPDGEAKVQFTTEGTRVYLTGFLQDRTYIVVAIYDELDNVGRHISVMSRHDGHFSYASQFLGTCQ